MARKRCCEERGFGDNIVVLAQPFPSQGEQGTAEQSCCKYPCYALIEYLLTQFAVSVITALLCVESCPGVPNCCMFPRTQILKMEFMNFRRSGGKLMCVQMAAVCQECQCVPPALAEEDGTLSPRTRPPLRAAPWLPPWQRGAVCECCLFWFMMCVHVWEHGQRSMNLG